MEAGHRFTSTHPAGCEPAFACSTWTQSHWNHGIENYIIRELIPLTEKLFQATVTDLLVPEGSVYSNFQLLLPMGVWQSHQHHALGNLPRKTLLTEATVICVLYHPVSRELPRAVSQYLCLAEAAGFSAVPPVICPQGPTASLLLPEAAQELLGGEIDKKQRKLTRTEEPWSCGSMAGRPELNYV